MVESERQKLLWDAKIIAVSKQSVQDISDRSIVDAYRVEYKGWGTKFSSWVDPARVCGCDSKNIALQVCIMIENVVNGIFL